MPSSVPDAASVPNETQRLTGNEEESQSRHRRDASVASAPALFAWAPEESEEPLRSAPMSTPGYRRANTHRRAREKYSFTGTSDVSEPDFSLQENEEDRPVSFQDKLAAQALAGTLEFLKIAGGLTLSTTGKLVAPPLHVTRTVILPNLWDAFVDYLRSITPERAKDWFRILRTSIHHFFTVLKNTARGKIFRYRVVRVGTDLLDFLSSDISRQVLIDYMGCSVKFAEALHTPEFKALLEQLSVLSCRVVDAAASGRNKQLLHDWNAMLWSGCELLADPSTTLALAEVTSYLCYALEMEDAALHNLSKEQLAERRKERSQYQRATYVDPTLVTDPEATVEQVILSSMGVATQNGETDGVDDSSIPSSVVVEQTQENEWEQTSIRQKVEEQRSEAEAALREEDEESEWHERARNGVDLPFLEEKITRRAVEVERQRTSRTKPYTTTSSAAAQVKSTDRQQQDRRSEQKLQTGGEMEEVGVVTTVEGEEEEGEDVPARPASSAKGKVQLEVSPDDDGPPCEPAITYNKGGWPHAKNSLPLEGETSENYFYRTLDEMLNQKRKDAVRSMFTGYVTDAVKQPKEGKVRTRQAQQSKVSPSKGTVKQRLAALGAQIDDNLDQEDRRKLKEMERVVHKHKRLVFVGLALLGLIVVSWVGFGCYGIYCFLYPSAFSSLKKAKSMLTRSPVHSNQEIVIRIVREVVHVDEEGNVLEGKGRESTVVSQEGIDKITQCVAQAL